MPTLDLGPCAEAAVHVRRLPQQTAVAWPFAREGAGGESATGVRAARAGACDTAGDTTMCVLDLAAKEAEVARYLLAHPRAEEAGIGHPALGGCDEVAWSDIPGCPAEIPAVLRGLLHQEAAPEAARVLTNVLMDSVFSLGAAMPAALPFLLRLAADLRAPVRERRLDILLVAAELALPVDAGDERAVRLFGGDDEHPERAQCRAVFAEHAELLATLPDELVGPDDRASLLRAAGMVPRSAREDD